MQPKTSTRRAKSILSRLNSSQRKIDTNKSCSFLGDALKEFSPVFIYFLRYRLDKKITKNKKQNKNENPAG